MRSSIRPSLALAALLATGVAVAPLSAQDGPGHNHIGHVADGFRGTPDGAGLLPTAMMEAEVALQHAQLAARDPGDLGNIKRHTAHVLHALDPREVENGPGKGYGLVRAVEGAVQHIEMAAGTDGASDGVKTHANHVSTAAGTAAERAQRMVQIATHIMETDSQEGAAEGIARLAELAQQVISGHDENGDGRVGWQAPEGGLEQAMMHLNLMKRGEGMGG